MVRRAIAVIAGLLLAIGGFMAGVAAAQQSPDTIPTTTTTTSTTSTSVLPDEVTTTTTTTTEPEETTTTAAVPDTAPQVSGDVVSRPLPRTGSDLNGTALFGGALTIVGIALALGARRRRNSFESA
jgi:LPXTG-motif cell wall-anchored protein